jgi:hypothetical protein
MQRLVSSEFDLHLILWIVRNTRLYWSGVRADEAFPQFLDLGHQFCDKIPLG